MNKDEKKTTVEELFQEMNEQFLLIDDYVLAVLFIPVVNFQIIFTL